MYHISAFPRYFQGPSALSQLRKKEIRLGEKPFLLITESKGKAYCQEVPGATVEICPDKIKEASIPQLATRYRSGNCDYLAAMGDESLLDSAKLLASRLDCPLLLIPSSPASFTACSSRVYTADLVLVDSTVLASSSEIYFASGMALALATSVAGKTAANRTIGGEALANAAYETLVSQGLKAKLAFDRNCTSPAFEAVLEVIMYISVVNEQALFSSSAYTVYRCIKTLKAQAHLPTALAFCALVQLFLENCSVEKISEYLDLCMHAGLPICLEDLEITQRDWAQVQAVLSSLSAEGEDKELYGALMSADAFASNAIEEL